MLGVFKKDPTWVEAAQIASVAASQLGRHEIAIQLSYELATRRPEDPVGHYNLACSLSMAGLVDVAADSMVSSILLGFRDLEALEVNSMLINLLESDKFEAVEEVIEALAVKGEL